MSRTAPNQSHHTQINRYIKMLLMDRFTGKLLICYKNGQSDVIMPFESAEAIIHDYKAHQYDDPEKREGQYN